MKIVIVAPKCINIYRQRMIVNLDSLMGDKHEIEVIQPQKNLYAKLQAMSPRILFLICGGREHGEIQELFKGKDVVIVSDTYKDVGVFINDDPEQVLPLLAGAIDQGKDFSEVPGITYRHKTRPAKKWDVNTVKPTTANSSFITFSTHGCKGQCSFCAIGRRQGSLRYRNIPDIICEVKQFQEISGYVNFFRFGDPSFDSNFKARMKEILKAIIRELPGHTYEANFRPDFHKMADAELMELLFKSGCTSAFIGVESANTADLDLFNKKTTVEDAERTIELFRSIDACVRIGFINIAPTTTLQGLGANLLFLQRHRLATFDTLTRKLDLFPGLPINQRLLKDGLLWGSQGYDFRDPIIKALLTVLNDIKGRLNKKAVELYSDINLKEVKRFKRSATLNEDTGALEIIAKYEPVINDLANRVSDHMCKWFLTLLEMINERKPTPDIMAASDSFINDELMAATIKAFRGLEKELSKELTEYYGDETWVLVQTCEKE
ncbi:MAG: radical SAM protein [Eubacteriales bacterium]|nr:radical SAM protein [Eubacteriales bacterium]MDD4475929.1 radical SAM protein [Eubacteriales bacterium]